jgi:hypothetical protein
MTEELERASARTAESYLPQRLQKPRLNTVEASEYLLSVHGVKIAPATLAKLRNVGGGARFSKFGSTVLYQPAELDTWALAKLGEPLANTARVKRKPRTSTSA